MSNKLEEFIMISFYYSSDLLTLFKFRKNIKRYCWIYRDKNIVAIVTLFPLVYHTYTTKKTDDLSPLYF